MPISPKTVPRAGGAQRVPASSSIHSVLSVGSVTPHFPLGTAHPSFMLSCGGQRLPTTPKKWAVSMTPSPSWEAGMSVFIEAAATSPKRTFCDGANVLYLRCPTRCLFLSTRNGIRMAEKVNFNQFTFK